MNWREHLVIGVLFTALFFLFIEHTSTPFQLILLLVCGGMSALVPDLDHKDSMGKSLLDVGFVVSAGFYSYSSKCPSGFCLPDVNALGLMVMSFLALVGLYFIFFRFFKPKHRGITHTILFAVLYSVLFFVLFGQNFGMAAFIGYFSHLVADSHIKLI